MKISVKVICPLDPGSKSMSKELILELQQGTSALELYHYLREIDIVG